MKTMLPLFFLLAGFVADAQVYSTVEVHTGFLYANGNKINAGSGGALTAGYNFKGFNLGAGAALQLFSKRDYHGGVHAYVPLFVEAGYYKPKWKVSPYIAARAGYGIYDGDSRMIGLPDYGNKVTGGLYLGAAAGVRIRVGNLFITPFFGVADCGFRAMESRYNSQFYCIGWQMGRTESR